MSASEDKEMNNPKWAIDAQGALACSSSDGLFEDV
jgi:hypothetical protein